MNRWQPILSATEAGSLIFTLHRTHLPVRFWRFFFPPSFSIWAFINYPNENATWTLVLGGGLITVANILIQLKPARK